jgi:putative transposase
MAVWADGQPELLHYEVAETESEADWRDLFAHLIERGVDPQALELVCSDGSLGLPQAIAAYFPKAQQQRCITHKVRGIERHLNYEQLPLVDAQQQPLKPTDARQQRRFEMTSDAYEVFEAVEVEQAQNRLQSFDTKLLTYPSSRLSLPPRERLPILTFALLSIERRKALELWSAA